MNKLNYPDPSNGIRLYFEDLEYQLGLQSYDSGLIQSFEDTLSIFGSDFIVSGCLDLGGSVTGDGWIMLGGELIRVKQHTRTNTYFAKLTETNSTGARTDALSNSINVWEQIRAEATSASGNLAYNGITLDKILERDISTRSITTSGIATLLTNENLVSVNVATMTASTINVPDGAESNKGHIIAFAITAATMTGTLTIQDVSATNIITYPIQKDLNRYLIIRSDGSSWTILSEQDNVIGGIGSDVNIYDSADYEDGDTVFNLSDGMIYITGTYNTSSGTTIYRLPNPGKARVYVIDVDINVGTHTFKIQNNAGTLDIRDYTPTTSPDETFTLIAIDDDNIVEISSTLIT